MSITETGDKPKAKAKGKKNAPTYERGERLPSGSYAGSGGGPTKYKPEFCDDAIKYGKRGKSIVWMASRWNVSRETVYAWMDMQPEFSDAMKVAQAHCQAWWEDKGETGMGKLGFKGDVWARNMTARFRQDWTETKNVNQTNEDGPNRAKAIAEDRARSLELIERLGLAAATPGARATTEGEGESEFPFLRDLNRRPGGTS